MNRKSVVAILAGAGLIVSTWAWAQQGTVPQQPPTGSTGQGMMGGQGPQGGIGAGPGMMGGRGPQGAGPGGMPGPYGRGVPGMGMRRGVSMFERPLISDMLGLQQQLGLASDQVQRLQTLRSDFEKEAIRRSADIQVAEVDLSSLLEADQPDLPKIEAQVKKIGAMRADLRFARIKTLEQGRAVLSPEQWKKFESLVPRRGPMGPYGAPGRGGEYGLGSQGLSGMMGPGMIGSAASGMMGGYNDPYDMIGAGQEQFAVQVEDI